MSALVVLGALGLGGAYLAQLLRWLRVMQREHYLPGSASRFLSRWTSPTAPGAQARHPTRRPLTLSHILVVALIASLLAGRPLAAVVVSILYGLTCPTGLSLRGRTGRLRWTRRASTTAALVTALAAVIVALSMVASAAWAGGVIVVWLTPLLVDGAARVMLPLEDRRARVYVARAAARLATVRPRIVAITGSYGKTSTKQHLAHLLGDALATPGSYNNRAGISRTINEQLTDGTAVFIAEMGTYGPGEIRALCAWCPPEVAVVTAIGPVHLERMGSVGVIEEAKREITERALTVVLNGDDERLRSWVASLRDAGKKVLLAGSQAAGLDVRVRPEGEGWVVEVGDQSPRRLSAPVGLRASNVACAIAAGLALGRDLDELVTRAATLPAVTSRATVAVAPSGVTVVDDTYNANPASARAAVDLLLALDVPGRRVLVTPGMVELGRIQYGENLALGRRAAAHRIELVVVGRTNAVPLGVGYGEGARRVNRRDQAVAWVRSALGPGDAVLYLNDLPDHYP